MLLRLLMLLRLRLWLLLRLRLRLWLRIGLCKRSLLLLLVG
jgi:hypothetical protein